MNASDLPVARTKVFALNAMLAVVADETGVPVRELRSRSRLPHQVEARKAFINRASEAGFGCWSIGRALNRDHTTVLHHLGRLA